VAWNDNRRWIASHRFADVARAFPLLQADPPSEHAVGRGGAPSKRAHRTIKLAAERIESREIDRNRGKVDVFAAEIARDVGDQRRNPGGRRSRARAMRPRAQATLGRGPVAPGQLHGHEPAIIPGDAAGSEHGVEDAMIDDRPFDIHDTRDVVPVALKSTRILP
jgi:hypothetical protein